MEEKGVRGVMRYHRTGSRWLIDEYLEAHPGIAADVEAERRGTLDRVRDAARQALPF